MIVWSSALPTPFSSTEAVFDELACWFNGGIVGEKVVGEGFGEPLRRCWVVLIVFPSV